MIASKTLKILLLAALCPAALLVISGCAMLGFGADPAGYGTRALSYEGYDFTVLRNKTIVLDPGHGGSFSGAVGK